MTIGALVKQAWQPEYNLYHQVNVKKHKLHKCAVAGRPVIFLSAYFTINYGLEDCYVADLIALEQKIVI